MCFSNCAIGAETFAAKLTVVDILAGFFTSFALISCLSIIMKIFARFPSSANAS